MSIKSQKILRAKHLLTVFEFYPFHILLKQISMFRLHKFALSANINGEIIKTFHSK